MQSWSEFPSLVRITADRGADGESVGAGVLVAPGWLLTAAHVLDERFKSLERAPSEGSPPSRIELRRDEWMYSFAPSDDDIKFATGKSSGVGEPRDLALIRIPAHATQPAMAVEPLWRGLDATVCSAQPRGRARLRYVGFPAARSDPRSELIQAEWDLDNEVEEAARVFIRHGGVTGGFSGGPLFLELPERQRRWIGVTVLGGSNMAACAFVLARDIAAFLDRSGIELPTLDGSLPHEMLKRELAHVAKLCATLPMEYGVELDTVFVPRVVDDEPDARASAPNGGVATPPGATKLVRRLFPRSTQAAAEHFVLKGVPGCGKTTLLRHTCWRLARAWRRPSLPFAIYVRLPDVCDAFAPGKPDFDSLLHCIQVAAGPYVRELFARGQSPSPAALILDGYDETPKDESVRNRVRALIVELRERESPWRIVVATRPTGFYRHNPAFEPLRLLAIEPLGTHDGLCLIERVVDSYRKKTNPDRALDLTQTRTWFERTVARSSTYADERGNPLWLTLTALHIAENGVPPASRTALQESILTMLLQGKLPRDPKAEPGSVRLPPAGRPVLELLALRMTEAGVVQLPRERLEGLLDELAANPGTQARAAALDRNLNGPRSSFFDLLHRLSILAPPVGGNDACAPWCFWHRSLLEYLTSRALLNRWSAPDERSRVLERAQTSVTSARDALLTELFDVAQAIARHEAGATFLAWARPTEAQRHGMAVLHGIIRGMSVRDWREECNGWSSNRIFHFVENYRTNCLNWRPPIELPEPPELAHDEPIRFWGEPLGLLAESLRDASDAEALFEGLAPAPDIARRALLSSGRATERSLRLVLDANDDEEQRGAILEQVPRLIGEPNAAIELLVRLGLTCRYRSDLYFIDEALESITRDVPVLAVPVRAAQARMFRVLVEVDATALRSALAWSTIPAGEYLVGEKVDQRVSIPVPLRVGSVTVTRGEYLRFDPSHAPKHSPGVAPKDPLRLPAYEVSWYAANAYARWLGWIIGDGRGRLPTEQEWEVACRAGSPAKQRWSNGDAPERLGEVGRFGCPALEGPFEVGSRESNAWGLFDMHGNVWEWCLDLYKRGPRRVLRGGCYGSTDASCRSGHRSSNLPSGCNGFIGFRVVLPAAPARGSKFDL